MHAGAVVYVGHDRVVAVCGSDLSRVGDVDIGTEQVESRVKVVVDEVHQVGSRATRIDPVNRAIEGNRSLVVRILPGVLEVRQDVRYRRDVGRVVDEGDHGLASIDHGAEGRPRVLGQSGSTRARSECLGREASGLERRSKRGDGLVVGVDNEDGNDIVGVRVDPRFDLCEIAFERTAVLKLAAVQGMKYGCNENEMRSAKQAPW